MSSIVEFIKSIVPWGIWLGASGLLKIAILFFMAKAIAAHSHHDFSMSKFNRMLVGEQSLSAKSKNH